MSRSCDSADCKEATKYADDLCEDFACSCCYDVLLDPTTLACGHTFCRFCLANWWNASRKAECLQCRRPFNEFPSVNFTLRNTIGRLLSSRVHEKRKIQEALPNYASVLAAFEEQARAHEQSANNGRTIRNISCGSICIILSVVIALAVLITIAVRTIFGGSEVLLHTKPITEWTPDDVANWVGEHGIWAKGVYDERFRKAGIDGNLLLRMREEDLIGPPINMALALHRRVLMTSLKVIYSDRLKVPGDFWTYKATNRAKSLFLLFGLRQFPRTTIFYLYLFDYRDVYLPFLHRTYKPEVTHPLSADDMIQMGKPATWSQWCSFVLLVMTAPYYLIGLFAYDYTNINYWMSRIVILHAIAMTGCEVTQIGWLFSRRGWRALPGMLLRSAALVLISKLALTILWPFIPFFICDMVFSWMFYISPFDALNRLFRRLNNFRHANQAALPEEADRNGGWHFDFQFRRG